MEAKLGVYPADHPVAIALVSMARALRFREGLLDALESCARSVGVRFGSETFDEAAALAGLPYCRQLDLYVDRETKRRADALPFSEAHRALLS